MPPAKTPSNYEIHNQKATQPEYFFSLALDRLQIEFKFQADYFGGRTLPGGMVLDFLVYTVPLPTPVWIQGEYWHRGDQAVKDKFQMTQLDSMMHGKFNKGVAVFGDDLKTEEAAHAAAKKVLRV